MQNNVIEYAKYAKYAQKHAKNLQQNAGLLIFLFIDSDMQNNMQNRHNM
jgi:hypothetical protein